MLLFLNLFNGEIVLLSSILFRPGRSEIKFFCAQISLSRKPFFKTFFFSFLFNPTISTGCRILNFLSSCPFCSFLKFPTRRWFYFIPTYDEILYYIFYFFFPFFFLKIKSYIYTLKRISRYDKLSQRRYKYWMEIFPGNFSNSSILKATNLKL